MSLQRRAYGLSDHEIDKRVRFAANTIRCWREVNTIRPPAHRTATLHEWELHEQLAEEVVQDLYYGFHTTRFTLMPSREDMERVLTHALIAPGQSDQDALAYLRRSLEHAVPRPQVWGYRWHVHIKPRLLLCGALMVVVGLLMEIARTWWGIL